MVIIWNVLRFAIFLVTAPSKLMTLRCFPRCIIILSSVMNTRIVCAIKKCSNLEKHILMTICGLCIANVIKRDLIIIERSNHFDSNRSFFFMR